MFGETAISWCSNKDPIMALSSCKIKYSVASLCSCQTAWLKNLLKKLGSEEDDDVKLMVEKVFAIKLVKNPIAHGISKNIEMIFHYLRYLVSEGRLRLRYCKSEDQGADLLTKGVTIEVLID